MGLLEQVRLERKARRAELAWPVGPATADRFEAPFGHSDARFSPESYGDYIVTSNEIFSAVSLRARLLSRAPMRLYDGFGTDKTEAEGPAVDLLRHVNPFWTERRLARMDELCMGLWGESYWAVERPAGDPSEIWWVKPSRMHPVPHETEYLAGFLYEPVTGMSGPLAFRPDEIVWFRYPNPIDEFSPLSPLAAARLAADTASQMMQSNQDLFRHGLQLGGMITPETGKVRFSQEQANDLETLLERRWSHPDNKHRWAVLRYEAQLKALNVTPKDAEFANGLNLTLRQVANAYGLPSPLLNDMEHATLSNAREYERIAWENALAPDAWLRADDIREQFLTMFRSSRPDNCEPDFSQIGALQESASASWARDRQAMDVGALKINEWRKRNGLPPVPWGDVWWAPVNKSAVSGASSQPQGDTAPAGEVDEQQAASALATLDMAALEFRHGRLSLNGHRKVNA